MENKVSDPTNISSSDRTGPLTKAIGASIMTISVAAPTAPMSSIALPAPFNHRRSRHGSGSKLVSRPNDKKLREGGDLEFA